MLDDVTGRPLPTPISATQRERQRHEMIAVINQQGAALDKAIKALDRVVALARKLDARGDYHNTRLEALERAHTYAMTRTRWQRIWNWLRG